MVDAEMALLGSTFQIIAVATGNAWLPMAYSLKVSTRRLALAEWSVRRPDTLA